MTSKFLKLVCTFFLFSSKNMRQHFFVKYVKTKLSLDRMGEKFIKFTTVLFKARGKGRLFERGVYLTNQLSYGGV